jgi:hypothetical protein
MIQVMNSRSNIDHERDENKVTDADGVADDEDQEGSGSYYYDDTTGYEVFQDGDEENEPSEDTDV